MSSFVFNIACPRCDTVVKIYLGQSEFVCSRCAFQVLVEDKDGLLPAFKAGQVEDLDFVESAIKDPMGTMEIGLKLTFSGISDSPKNPAAESSDNIASDVLDVDEFGNKTANTQIIQLTFDPAQYLDEVKGSSTNVKRGKNKKISLKKVIKHAETAKPPKIDKSQLTLRYITIAVIVILLGIIIYFIVQQQGQ